jgi:hypothetical protein
VHLQESVRSLLEQAPGEPTCNACLAFACSSNLTEIWQATSALVAAAGKEFASGQATCSSCRRATTTIAYSRGAKCAHCSRAIHDNGLGVVIEGDAFHRSCWQVLLSGDRIRLSRSLSRQSRELIAQARRSMKA